MTDTASTTGHRFPEVVDVLTIAQLLGRKERYVRRIVPSAACRR